MKNTKIKMNKNQKGQTLLFVIVAVTIAMAVGVAVSTRTISSLKRVARTDTSARVIAAAEGGIENLLGRNYSQLDKAIAADVGGCDAIEAQTGPESGTCQYVFNEDISEDLISSRAVVKVEEFSSNEEDGGYSFNLVPGSVKEVNLDTYIQGDIKICWDSNDSAIYYYSYNQDGEVLKGGLKPADGFQFGYISDRFVHEGISTEGSYLCKTVLLVGGSRYGLRIKVLYNNSKVAVFPTSGSLPTQGYKFTSVGEIVTGSGSEEKATVIVHKSYPYAPDIFDYGIYTPATLQ